MASGPRTPNARLRWSRRRSPAWCLTWWPPVTANGSPTRLNAPSAASTLCGSRPREGGRRRPPDLPGDAQEVAAHDSLDGRLRIAEPGKLGLERDELLGREEVHPAPPPVALGEDVRVIGQLPVEVVAVEDVVGADPDVLGPGQLHRVVDVPRHRRHADVVLAEEDADAVDADHPAGRGARQHLVVADIALVIPQPRIEEWLKITGLADRSSVSIEVR